MRTRKRAAEVDAVAPSTPDGETVRLYPVPGAYINGEPAAEREVTTEEAERLLRFYPPAYTTRSPAPAVEVVTESEVLAETPSEQPVVEVDEAPEPQE